MIKNHIQPPKRKRLSHLRSHFCQVQVPMQRLYSRIPSVTPSRKAGPKLKKDLVKNLEKANLVQSRQCSMLRQDKGELEIRLWESRPVRMPAQVRKMRNQRMEEKNRQALNLKLKLTRKAKMTKTKTKMMDQMKRTRQMNPLTRPKNRKHTVGKSAKRHLPAPRNLWPQHHQQHKMVNLLLNHQNL